MVRRQISSEVRKKVNTLIITDVHARDIIESFVRDSIMDASEFAWESQLRFYWDADADDLLIRQCTGGSWSVVLKRTSKNAMLSFSEPAQCVLGAAARLTGGPCHLFIPACRPIQLWL